MTTEQFWRTRPVDFDRMVEGYMRRGMAANNHFRQLYALIWNQWQQLNRKEPVLLSPQDIMLLHGEKKPRKKRVDKSAQWTEEDLRNLPNLKTRPLTWQEP